MENNPNKIISDRKIYLFIQIVDRSSSLAVHEIDCGSYKLSEIEKIIRRDKLSFKSNIPIYIDKNEIINLMSIIKVNNKDRILISMEMESGANDLAIITWSPDVEAPYRLHVGREFFLMKNNKKPLSVFIGRIPPDDSFVEIPEHLFDPYVERGMLLKREIREIEERPVKGIEGHRVVLYAQTDQGWRLDAYALVRSVGNKIGWSEPLIRLEGALLGYAEWQNDAYIARMKSRETAQ